MAARLYRRAAEAGDSKAQFSIGVCYTNGDGVKKDMREAVTWFRAAAAQEQAAIDAEIAAEAAENSTSDNAE
jgi:TPR repeat protein